MPMFGRIALVTALIVASASGIFAWQSSGQNLDLRGCQTLRAKLEPLVSNDPEGHTPRTLNYTQSLSASVDVYATLWNQRTTNLLKRSGVPSFATTVLDSKKVLDPVLGFAAEKVLALQVAVEAEDSVARRQELKKTFEVSLKGLILSSKLDDLDRRTFALGEYLAFGQVAPDLLSKISRKQLLYSKRLSIFDNVESYILATIKGYPTEGLGYPKKYLDAALISLLRRAPNGVALPLFNEMRKVDPLLFKAHALSVRSYIEDLRAKGGGFGISSGSAYEPQVTFYAAKLVNPDTTLLKSKNFNRMREGKVWIRSEGRMPLGLSIMSNIALNLCIEGKPLMFENATQILGSSFRARIQGCIEKYLSIADAGQFRDYLGDESMGSARRLVLSGICGIRGQYSIERSPGTNMGFKISHLNIREFLAYGISNRRNLDPAEFRQYLQAEGCGYSKSSVENDLISTTICVSEQVLVGSKASRAIGDFLGTKGAKLITGQDEAHQDSPEAVVWYFFLQNARRQFANFLVLY